jgi:hypothetical protein
LQINFVRYGHSVHEEQAEIRHAQAGLLGVKDADRSGLPLGQLDSRSRTPRRFAYPVTRETSPLIYAASALTAASKANGTFSPQEHNWKIGIMSGFARNPKRCESREPIKQLTE